MINGQAVRGVLRDPDLGCPSGCFELTGVSLTGAERSSLLANSSLDVEDETEEAWRAAGKKARVSAKAASSKDTDGTETSALRVVVQGGAADDSDSSGDDECFSAVWGKR
eukprot:5532980-Alexandrium_andersonii.AAC.1